jgi:hypothetical protein
MIFEVVRLFEVRGERPSNVNEKRDSQDEGKMVQTSARGLREVLAKTLLGLPPLPWRSSRNEHLWILPSVTCRKPSFVRRTSNFPHSFCILPSHTISVLHYRDSLA